jgi:carbamoylphosphate synthase large subunit
MIEANMPVPVSHFVNTLAEAWAVVDEIGYPP